MPKAPLFYGIRRKPKKSIYGNPSQSLKARQVRRFGEYEIPHQEMIAYLQKNKLPAPDYAKYGLGSGSKNAVTVTTVKKTVGRPKKTIITTTEKRGVGRPKKTIITTTEKRTVGRPKKVVASTTGKIKGKHIKKSKWNIFMTANKNKGLNTKQLAALYNKRSKK